MRGLSRRIATAAAERRSAAPTPIESECARLLLLNMPDAILRHGQDGSVHFASAGAEPLLGVSPIDLLGKGLFDRVHVADRPAYLAALADTSHSGKPQLLELRARRLNAEGDEQFVWVEMRSCLMTSGRAHDSVERREVFSVLRDIDQRKAQEHAVELARTDAERASVAKNRFLATMSHELRTPLNVIIGFSEMLIKESELMIDAARRREYAKLINDSGHHLLSVVNGILDMSKIEAGDFPITPEPFAPGAVVEHCCELLAIKAREAAITLETQIPLGLPEVVIDKRALKQVLLNLLSNAIKFTDAGGSILVSVAADERHLIVAVRDNGVGISSHDLPRLGEPFFQSGASYDRRHDGTGLGLSIVKGLVSLHGGDLEIGSRLGEGTCVTVRLPLDCELTRSREHANLVESGPRVDMHANEIQIVVKKSA